MTTRELNSLDDVLNLLGYEISGTDEGKGQAVYRNKDNGKKWTINVSNQYRDTLKSILLIELMQ